MTNRYTSTLMQRFEEKYIPEPNSGCWIWLGATGPNGYARMFYNGRNDRASHVSWLLHRETPIGTKHICHKCDVPSCVNPDHLFLGTHKDNCADKAIKGRVSNAKLHAYDIPTIINRRESGETLKEIATDYHVSEASIHRAITGETWCHVR
jgi:hypothetical protein